MANINLVFLPHYPKEYDPLLQYPAFMDVLPPVEPDPDFLWVAPRAESTLQQLTDVGVTHFTKGDMIQPGWTDEQVIAFRSQGYGYDDVPTTNVQFSLPDHGPANEEWLSPPGVGIVWPLIWNKRFFNTPPGATEPMSYDEGYQKGLMYNTEHTIFVGQNSENIYAVGTHWPFVRGWCDAWVPRMKERWAGKKILMAWNYFTGLGPNIKDISQAAAKQLFFSPLSSWPGSPMLPGGTLELMNAYCLPIYLSSPDEVNHIPYDIIFNHYIEKKTEKHCIVFEQCFHEWLPNVHAEWRIPEGKFYQRSKMHVSPNISYSTGLLGRIFLSAFIPFMFSGKRTNPHYKVDRQWHQEGLWVPNGNGETETADLNSCPAWGTPGTIENLPGYQAENDLGYSGYLYNRTFRLTKGGEDEWCEFRVDGGNWIPMENNWANDIVDAYHEGTGYVFSRRKDGLVSFLVQNPKAPDGLAHLYEWKFQGQIYQAYLSGTMPYAVNYKYM